MSVLEWMHQFDFLFGTSNNFMGYTLGMLNNPDYKKKIIHFIHAVDLDIEDLHSEKNELGASQIRYSSI